MCFNCRNITRNAAVHKRLIRYHRAQGSTSAKSRHDYLGPQLVLDRCRKLSATVRRLTNFLRSARDRATQLSLTNKLFTRAQANATRGDLVGCATKMARWVNSGMAGTDTAAVDMVTSVLGNLVMAGQKYTKTEQAFYKVIRVYGGPRLTEFVARNLAGPSRRTPERWLQLSRRRYRLGLNEDNIKAVAELLTSAMKAKGIAHPVPCQAAEDESAIQPRADWDQTTDTVIGYCGVQCTGRCERVTECTCHDRHNCWWGDVGEEMAEIGNDDEAYTRMFETHETRRVATQIRVIMVNPLIRGLPNLVIVMSPTCGAFTANDYVAKQWRELHRLWARHLEAVVGPLVGHASDGDSRRRKLQHGFAVAKKHHDQCNGTAYRWQVSLTQHANPTTSTCFLSD
jgi:hypothetical protein